MGLGNDFMDMTPKAQVTWRRCFFAVSCSPEHKRVEGLLITGLRQVQHCQAKSAAGFSLARSRSVPKGRGSCYKPWPLLEVASYISGPHHPSCPGKREEGKMPLK